MITRYPAGSEDAAAQNTFERSDDETSGALSSFPLECVGIFHRDAEANYVQGAGPIVVVIGNEGTEDISDGAHVVAEITERNKIDEVPSGRIKEVLEEDGGIGTDILLYAQRFDLPLGFNKTCLDQAKRAACEEPLPAGRLDLRNRTIITIDDVQSRDLDDAVSLARLPNGNWELGVHIADVSHYVQEGTLLDREALNRGTSVYLVDRVIPMLPKVLSNGVCSLNPHEDKLTLSCIMELDSEGRIVRHMIANSIIRTTERMTYEDVNLIFEGDPTLRERYAHIVPMLEDMNTLAEQLRKRRFDEGRIDFELMEPKIVLNEMRRPISVAPRERRGSEKLIEEFMLTANLTVAEEFHRLNLPFVYRVHSKPDLKKVQKLMVSLSNFGIRIRGIYDVRPKEFQNVLNQVTGKPEEGVVREITRRTLQQAKYATVPSGHFGLAVGPYCHFASPIRRYSDLVIHRIIKKYLAGRIDEKEKERLTETLPDICEHCSAMERRAVSATRAVTAMEMAQYMEDHLSEEEEGVVSGVTSSAIYVQLPNTIKGMVPRSALPTDYYSYYPDLYCLIGKQTGQRITLGDRIRVRTVRAKARTGKIEFEVAEFLEGSKKRQAARKKQGIAKGARSPKKGKR